MGSFAATIVLVCLVAAVVMLACWAFFSAQRLNRLHIRVDASLAALEAALNRRAAVIAALADDLRPLAVEAEQATLVPGNFSARATAEAQLLRAMSEKWPAEPPAILVDAHTRVGLAHRFYNEAVADTRALRLRPLVKAARLGGTARLPEFFELPSVELTD